jgi:hypothetical protein
MKLQIATTLLCFTFCSLASAQVSGSVNCTSPGKPDLKFQPQTAVGYFVKKSGAFSLAFFADKLSINEIRYWVASETAARDGKFEGKTHEDDATLEKRMAVLNARSVSVWGELKDHSKFATGVLPEVHNVADFSGLQLTACSNFGYLNAGISNEYLMEKFKLLTIPTPLGALSNSKAAVDFTYNYGKSGTSKADIAIKAEVPFFVVHE